MHSPHLGPITWAPVAEELAGRGLRVARPSLASLRDARQDFATQAAALVRDDLPSDGLHTPVLLVGHDWAGPMLPAIGYALNTRVVGYVFVDAHLPRHGASPLDLAGGGPAADVLRRVARHPSILTWSADALRHVIPDTRLRDRFLAELPRLPVAFYEEPIQVPGAWTGRAGAYLEFTEAYPASTREARDRGWPVRTVPGSHLEMLSQPGPVADALVALASELVSGQREAVQSFRAQPPAARDYWPGSRVTRRRRTEALSPRVVLVDDDVVGRAFLRARLAVDGIRVVAEADDGASAMAVVSSTRPDVVVMDIRMPGEGGFEATRAIADVLPEARVIILTAFDEPLLSRTAADSGAFAFLGKDSPAEVLVDLIRRAAGERHRTTGEVGEAFRD